MTLIPFSPFIEVSKQMDLWGEKRIPFVFLVDYLLENAWAGSEEEAKAMGIHFDFNATASESEQVTFTKMPLSFESYTRKFNQVQAGLKRGDSFLANLIPSYIFTLVIIHKCHITYFVAALCRIVASKIPVAGVGRTGKVQGFNGLINQTYWYCNFFWSNQLRNFVGNLFYC